ncbi:hypothetical protein POF45_00310 [Pseudomonas sp. 681]|uniref:Uncharacterized protein n=1 Tax=Pseudomonas fungipugnans TaxID=3024217 RepID=A0ABT6QGG2_9PSED|nr:hypothetical protein [Pseudomonas sp. 681]MDI2589875.1 hypothetical protein [Pseudomonas sp. 681]
MTEQARFPYVLITSSASVINKASSLSPTGIHRGKGITTFLADHQFDKVFSSLSEIGDEFGLVQANDLKYNHADGELARVFDHIK